MDGALRVRRYTPRRESETQTARRERETVSETRGGPGGRSGQSGDGSRSPSTSGAGGVELEGEQKSRLSRAAWGEIRADPLEP